MSVESEILRIQHNVADTYAAVAEKGGTVPLQPNSANLPASVRSITSSGEMISGDGLSKDGDTLNVDNPVRGILTQAEYEALPETQKASGTYFVDDGSTCTCKQVYDNQERVIGTFFGKPLYQKVIMGTSEIPAGTLGQLSGTITDAMLPEDAFYLFSELSLAPEGYFQSCSGLTIEYATGAIKFVNYCSSYKANPKYTLKLVYTKTTDQEVSA